MQNHLDNLTKPVGSLGKLEEYAMKMARIQNKVPPIIEKKAVYVIAGDHGINTSGVSMFPSEVTPQMVMNFVSGGAGINVLANHCGFEVKAVDAGVAADFDNPGIIDCKVAKGTKNFHEEEAMSDSELEKCLENGKRLAKSAVADGYQLTALGDMGISNTSSAAAMVVAAGLEADSIIDKGTGISDELLEKKRRIILESILKHAPYSGPMDIMRKLGGFELCTMAGFILGLKGRGVACMIDGFPVTSGAYMAWLIDPSVSDYLFAGHKSKVKGHKVMLDAMGLEPIVDFNMRLGEGTGAVIGGFMVELGVRISREMASFASAGVTNVDNEEAY
ncbi:MAG: nicotinate-nucleotide--dimethylbenzimidazole phosphoribosyltransferase [Spirochaetales bacterium]|nr:nicotinate-nucleotide--dimethylbenzimidazole phosphoribosyltransferase [Spirochaetales bacterium]